MGSLSRLFATFFLIFSIFAFSQSPSQRVYTETRTTYKYDIQGNVIKQTTETTGNPHSKLTAQIEYYESNFPYYGGIAKKLEVKDQKGLVRKREAEINPATAELIKVKNYFTASEFAQTDLEYDKFGNLKSITGAENEKGQRAKLVYTYDNATHSHITSIKDQFGYENLMAYDYRFNTPIKTTDRNGETMTYTLDAKGRIATILAPKEAKSGKAYTIKYEYPSPLTPKGGSNPSNGMGSISNTSPFGGQGAGLYTYIQQQGYDEFEQKVYRRLGNGTETTYTYDPVMRRLSEGMEPEDWIKIGNRIFYDSSVNRTYEAQQKYGNDATSITGYHVTKGDFTTHYYLGKGGIVTTISGNLDFLATTKSVYGIERYRYRSCYY